MDSETLVHKCLVNIAGFDYEIMVFSRHSGNHVAKTVLAPDDVIINDGLSLREVLEKHRQLLPLAISSRLMLRDFRAH